MRANQSLSGFERTIVYVGQMKKLYALLLIPYLYSFFRNFTFTKVFHDFPNRVIAIPDIMLRFSY